MTDDPSARVVPLGRRYIRDGRSPTWLIVSLCLAFVAAVPLGGALLPWSRLAGTTAMLLGLVLSLGGLLRASTRYNTARLVELTLDDEALRADGAVVARRGDIASGLYVPPQARSGGARDPACVRLADARGARIADVVVADEAEGVRLLEELKLGAHRRTAHFSGVTPMWSAGGRALLGSIAAWLLGMGAAIALRAPWLLPVVTVAVCIAMLALVPSKVHVGADGVLYEDRLSRRFIAFDDIASAELIASGIALKTRAGGEIPLPLTSRGKMYYPYEREAQTALLARVREALAVYQSAAPVDLGALLARQDRPVAAWLAALERLGGSYRGAAVAAEELWRVVESATSSVSARAAAAVLLARSSGSEARERLRVVADGCAAPALRVVLEKAADGDERAVVETLDAVHDEHLAAGSKSSH